MIDRVAEIIGEDMTFQTFDVFMSKKEHIKDVLAVKYEDDLKYFAIYRMYVGSRPWINEYHKDCIWSWLNGYMTDVEFYDIYFEHLEKIKKYKMIEKEVGIDGEE